MEKLIEIMNQIPHIKATENEENPIAYLKFYNLLGRGEWYATELDIQDDDLLMFGYVKSPLGEDFDEFGYFTLNQLIECNVIEFDRKFKPCPIKEVMT